MEWETQLFSFVHNYLWEIPFTTTTLVVLIGYHLKLIVRVWPKGFGVGPAAAGLLASL